MHFSIHVSSTCVVLWSPALRCTLRWSFCCALEEKSSFLWWMSRAYSVLTRPFFWNIDLRSSKTYRAATPPKHALCDFKSKIGMHVHLSFSLIAPNPTHEFSARGQPTFRLLRRFLSVVESPCFNESFAEHEMKILDEGECRHWGRRWSYCRKYVWVSPSYRCERL